MNTGEGGLHADLEPYQDNIIVQCASGRFGVDSEYLQARRGGGDQDRPGRQAGHRRAPARREDRQRGLDHAHDPAGHRRPLPRAAPRHLLHRGPAPAHLRAQGGHGLQAGRREDRRRAQRRRHRLGHRARRRRHRLPRRLPGRHRRRAARSSATTSASRIEIAIAVVDQRLRDEGIRNRASIVAAGGIRSSADVVKAIALGADACAIGTAALVALGCHVCQRCHTGCCSWGICTQKPELTRRLDPEWGAERLVNLVHAWSHEIAGDPRRPGRERHREPARQPRAAARPRPRQDRPCEILGVKPAGL